MNDFITNSRQGINYPLKEPKWGLRDHLLPNSSWLPWFSEDRHLALYKLQNSHAFMKEYNQKILSEHTYDPKRQFLRDII